MGVRAVRKAVPVEGAEPRGVRVLAHTEPDPPCTDIAHVHLGAAADPRKDIAQ